MAHVPYPHRSASSVAAWKEHILAALAWKAAKYGAAKWEGVIAEELGARGLAAAKALAAEGKIALVESSEYSRGVYSAGGHFGRKPKVHGAGHHAHFSIELL